MDRNKRFYLADKFNAQEVERAAVVLGYDVQQRNSEDYEELFAIQSVHRGFGDFPTTIYRVPRSTTAREVIGIERYFGQERPQKLPIELPPISEVTGIEDYGNKEGIEVVGNTDFQTFLEIFKLDIGSQLDDSLVKRVMV